MNSTSGPRMAKGDINNDGLEDLFICGAKDQAGVIYLQQAGGKFISTNRRLLEADAASEDTDALFFDADGDHDADLYVCSGGNEFSPNSTALINRLYINDGHGKFSKSPQVLPSYIFESTSCVRASDYDGDGDQDLFVGVRLVPFRYGIPCKGYLLNNDGKGHFTDVGAKAGPGLAQLGMITDASWIDYDRDGRPNLVITGEYMAIRMFHNENGVLKETTDAAGLSRSKGWWNRIQVADLNNDGYPDIIAGNHGLNSRFTASVRKPVTMHVGDFAGNGTIQQITSCFFGDSSYPMHLRHDLVAILPALKKKYLKYESYKSQQVTDIFTSAQLTAATKLEAYTLESSVFLNNGKGGFEQKPLPVEAQFSPVYGISVLDINGDGNADLAIAGNLYQAKPEVGIYDASYGQVLLGDGKGNFRTVSSQQSGMFVRGAARDIIPLKAGKNNILIVAENNGPMHIFRQQVATGKK